METLRMLLLLIHQDFQLFAQIQNQLFYISLNYISLSF